MPLKVSAAWWFSCFVLFSSLSSSPYHPPLPASRSLRTIHVVIVFNTAHQKHLTTGFNLWFLAAWCTIKSVVLSQYQRKSWRTIKFKIIVLEIMIACVPTSAVIVKRALICFSSATKCFAELCNLSYPITQTQH